MQTGAALLFNCFESQHGATDSFVIKLWILSFFSISNDFFRRLVLFFFFFFFSRDRWSYDTCFSKEKFARMNYGIYELDENGMVLVLEGKI